MSPEPLVVFAAIALPFLAAAATLVFRRFVGVRTGYAGAVVALASFGLVASQLGTEGRIELAWIPSLDVTVGLYVDAWAMLFALLASGIGVLVLSYSGAYMYGEQNLARYYATLLAFMGSIVGVAFAADLIALFLFWELTSVCSFVLIGHYTDDEASQYAARMAMFVTVGGGLCLLVGVLLLSVVADSAGVATFDLAAMLAQDEAVRGGLRDAGLFVPVLALFAIAAGAKSAQVPLHFWLPNAMVAPTPVSAFLHSATMVKVGVYFIGRIRPLFLGPEWTAIFVVVGLATMTVGAILAVAATDIKRLLAYSTASHLGLMVAGFGFASAYGAEAGVFHLLNHALFKAALFLVAGIVAHEVGTRRITDLGGLWRDLPVTAAITLVAAGSMAGFPPFNGFYSKELLFEAAYETAVSAGGIAWLFPVVAVVASIFTVLYSLRFLAIFFGTRPSGIEVPHRAPVGLVVPPAVLAVLAAIVGLSPQLAIDVIVQDAVTATAIGEPVVAVGIPLYLSGPVVMSVITIAGGVAAYPFYGRIRDAIETVVRPRHRVRPSWWYGRLVAWIEMASDRLARFVHNGLLRTYVAWAVAAASILTLLGYRATGVGVTPFDVSIPLAMALVLAVAIVAAVAVTITPSHVAGVLTLGILGFMLAIFYITASAPDLALTQLVVETLLVLIFLLVLEELPSFYAETDVGVLVRDAVLSVVVGAAAFVTVLVAAPVEPTSPTTAARFYAAQAVPGGGGTNVVNVVLVDFRIMDTLGELVVVAVAAIGVLVLVTMRARGETE